MDRIKIHNFGPIKDVDIELSKLIIFIGSQGVGKSAIAKLLTIFSDALWWKNICDDNDTMYEFKKMRIDKYFNKDTYIEYHGRDGINIFYKENKFDISFDSVQQEKKRELCNQLVVDVTKDEIKKLGYEMNDPQIEKVIEKNSRFLRANLRMACYIPAERNTAGIVSSSLANIVLSKIPLPPILIEYISLFEKAKNHYNTYDASFLGVKYDKNKGDDCISVLGNDDKHIPLEDCSSGIQSALPMLMVAEYACEDKCFDTFVVEEPEQNLFPTNQREVLNKLISLSRKEDCKYMIINTHSPYMLSVLNVNMLAAKLAKKEEYKKEVENIVPSQFCIDSNDVSVYYLGGNTYCKSVIDEKTGLVSGNYLDAISDTISSDFNKLYQIFLKSFQN